ncbi:MAG: DUF2293 domain-containing protein [Candidatus Eisenbacteria bacterium]|uniref:DUF2293 domain-containing protein n=1 Tax=Eiseniibacteriota bacterium TaxID=2212470 RepID=A0A948W4H1_UNCEI|nr:DUF2293 domain-containing protein [Candidatus Eisenbacteria bacterium]
MKIFISSKETSCGECGANLGHHAWITLAQDRGALCLSCADLDHLMFLPSGDAALTRRARKHSVLSAVVLKWSKARKRYERKGLMVEESALERAEFECLADSDIRSRRREREAERRAELDQQYVEEFSRRIRELYPQCPPGRETTIAEHACCKYSGRVGRSAAAKNFDITAVDFAVNAHIRHSETKYDFLLAQGLDRMEARRIVEAEGRAVATEWGRSSQ